MSKDSYLDDSQQLENSNSPKYKNCMVERRIEILELDDLLCESLAHTELIGSIEKVCRIEQLESIDLSELKEELVERNQLKHTESNLESPEKTPEVIDSTLNTLTLD